MINYIEGDLLEQEELLKYPSKIICHIVNNKGAWGSGFVISLSRKWKEPERIYLKNSEFILNLGFNQYVQIENDSNTIVCNMIAQDGFISSKNFVPLNYESLKLCLKRLFDFISIYEEKPVVLMPRIGTNRGGGSWQIIEEIINNELCHKKVKVYVYTLPFEQGIFK